MLIAKRLVKLSRVIGESRVKRIRQGILVFAALLGECFYFILFVNYRKKGNEMKKIFKSAISLILVAILLVSFASCGSTDPWADAIYTEDKTFGEGSKTVTVIVTVGENSVTFTVNTDKKILGDALLEHQLVEGEMGDFGLYIKKVNGITADYNVDQSYWSFTKNGEYMMTGVDGVEIANGEQYELTYAK